MSSSACTCSGYCYQAAKTEEGRSMVEMLGTLAIIGVLSVGGVAGYTYAMNKHKVNELIDGASKRAVIATQQIMTGKAPEDVSLAEFNDNEKLGGTFVTEVLPVEGGEFGIQINDVDESVCEALADMADDGLDMVKVSGNTVVDLTADDCSDNKEQNVLAFIYGGVGDSAEESKPCSGDWDCCDDIYDCHRVCRNEQCVKTVGADCSGDWDCSCGGQYLCRNGSCVSAEDADCCGDWDCWCGYSCVNGKCVGVECSGDSECACGSEYICYDPYGNVGPGVNTNNLGQIECSGYHRYICTVCGWEACGSCVPAEEAGCCGDWDCASGEYCVNSKCNSGIAGKSCSGDYDCASGYYCVNGQCDSDITGKSCSGDYDCATGYICVCGQCDLDSEFFCSGAYDCASGYNCVCGQCVPYGGSSGCSRNSDCPRGYYCDSLEMECLRLQYPYSGQCADDTDCEYPSSCTVTGGDVGYGWCEGGGEGVLCDDDGICASGYRCYKESGEACGYCVPECCGNEDCVSGYACYCGYCVS